MSKPNHDRILFQDPDGTCWEAGPDMRLTPLDIRGDPLSAGDVDRPTIQQLGDSFGTDKPSRVLHRIGEVDVLRRWVAALEQWLIDNKNLREE